MKKKLFAILVGALMGQSVDAMPSFPEITISVLNGLRKPALSIGRVVLPITASILSAWFMDDYQRMQSLMPAQSLHLGKCDGSLFARILHRLRQINPTPQVISAALIGGGLAYTLTRINFPEINNTTSQS